MRFRELRLSAYGPFTDALIDFGAAGNTDLHIVSGPNEAGKSTTLRAIDALLFGFPNQTDDAHTHPYDHLRVGALIDDPDGHGVELARVKRRRGTLRDAADEPLAEEVLTRSLGGVDPEHYRRLFLIDQEQLRIGGQGLLAGGGELGISLFGATLGAGNLAALVWQLRQSHEDLFSTDTKARKPPLNAALRAYREHSDQARKLSVRPREYDQTRREVDRLAIERAGKEHAVAEHESEVSRLERLASVAGPLARRQAIVGELDQLNDVPDLRAGATRRRELATQKLSDSERRLKVARERRAEQTREIDSANIADDLLARAETIRALADEAGKHESALRDRPKRARDLEVLEESQRAMRDALEHPLPQSAVAFQERTGKEIEDLGEQRVLVIEQHRIVSQKLDAARQALELARATLDGAPAAPARPSTLASWLEAAAEQLPRATAAEEKLARIERDLEVLRGRSRELSVPVDLEDPPSSPLPSRSTIDSYREQFEALANEQRELTLEYKRLQERSEDLAHQNKTLGGKHALQLTQQIDSSRAERDQTLIELQGLLVHADLEGANERAVRLRNQIAQADRNADLAREQADRIARTQQISGELSAIAEDQAKLELALKARPDKLCELVGRWREEWSTCKIEPTEDPTSMIVWLERYEQMQATHRELLADRERERGVLARAEEVRGELLRACSAAGSSADESLPLAQLAGHARAAIERINEEIAADHERHQTLLASENGYKSALEELNSCKQTIAALDAEWSQALAPLGLSGQATPMHARAQIAALREILRKHQSAQELKHRITAIDEEYAAYTAAVKQICTDVASDLDSGEPIGTIRELRRRVESAQTEETRVKHLIEQRQAQQQQINELEMEREEAVGQLDSLLKEAQCVAVEELPAIEERAERRTTLQRELRELEQRITEQGEQNTEELEAALQGRTSDQLAVERSNAEAVLLSAREERDTLIGKHAEASERLRMLDHGTEAARASEQAEEYAAAATGLIHHYLAERGAAILLRRAIDRHRERSAHPVLERAQDLLVAFTGGSLTKLLVHDAPNGKPILLARRVNGAELDVEGMSSGTRDQLYLALRLAALEHHLKSRQPLPVLLDDVLVNSDEQRVSSAMPELAQLATHTQVIMLTHHQHVGQIAKERLGEDVRVHDLTAGVGRLQLG